MVHIKKVQFNSWQYQHILQERQNRFSANIVSQSQGNINTDEKSISLKYLYHSQLELSK